MAAAGSASLPARAGSVVRCHGNNSGPSEESLPGREKVRPGGRRRRRSIPGVCWLQAAGSSARLPSGTGLALPGGRSLQLAGLFCRSLKLLERGSASGPCPCGRLCCHGSEGSCWR